MNLITLQEARQWCIKAHGKQRYGHHLYAYHLDRVAEVAIRFGYGDDLTLMKCYGHDVIEDTDKSKADMLEAGFAEDVVEDVSLVSDQAGANRKERKAKTYLKIVTRRSAIQLKLFDRIANVESSKINDKKKYKMYKKEQSSFEEALRDSEDKEMKALWFHLNSLFEE